MKRKQDSLQWIDLTIDHETLSVTIENNGSIIKIFGCSSYLEQNQFFFEDIIAHFDKDELINNFLNSSEQSYMVELLSYINN